MRTGYFRGYGGRFVPELLVQPLIELEEAWRRSMADEGFLGELEDLLAHYAGRPTPLTEAAHYAASLGGGRIFLKREDLLHTGAHKLNNALGQCLLARAMGKRAVIAETGAGQHGLAAATACARLGLECTVFMGGVDMDRQRPNVDKMLLLGARVERVEQGSATLKEAVNEALREWAAEYETTHYCLGSALGPHPYPSMVASFQAVIGREARRQVLERTGRLPDLCVACVGGGSNAIGLFSAFALDDDVKLVGVEAGGTGPEPGRHAARFLTGSPGILHGCRTFVLQDAGGQILGTHSISAGLDYPAVGPEHAALHELGRAAYDSVGDAEALRAFKNLSRSEGIIPALETSHALAWVENHAAEWRDRIVLVCLSGRGDKDLPALKGML